MAIVTLRYWAAAKEAAGCDEETITAETLAEAIAAACGREPGGQAGRHPTDGHGLATVGHGGRERAGDQGQATGRDPGRLPAPDVSGNPRLRAVLARSSFLIDGVPVGVRAPEAVTLSDAAVIEVLPPFAGG
jgi:molybdopterin converting factor small subunit